MKKKNIILKMYYIQKIENNEITELELWDNNIGYKGAEEIAKALPKNTSLKVLELSYNNIGSKGAEEIAKALSNNTSLQYLYLTHNNIGDKGTEEIAKMLSKNTSLQNMYLWSNNIGEKGAEAIAKALHNNTLQTLALGANNIGDKGAEEISKALYYNTSLQVLQLSINKFSDSIKSLLERNAKLSKKKWIPIVFNIVLNFPKLPTYILLDIVDTYPDYHLLNKYQKVSFIDYCKEMIN